MNRRDVLKVLALSFGAAHLVSELPPVAALDLGRLRKVNTSAFVRLFGEQDGRLVYFEAEIVDDLEPRIDGDRVWVIEPCELSFGNLPAGVLLTWAEIHLPPRLWPAQVPVRLPIYNLPGILTNGQQVSMSMGGLQAR